MYVTEIFLFWTSECAAELLLGWSLDFSVLIDAFL